MLAASEPKEIPWKEEPSCKTNVAVVVSLESSKADTGRCGADGDRGEIGSGVALAAGAGIKEVLTPVAGAVPAAATGGTGILEAIGLEKSVLRMKRSMRVCMRFFFYNAKQFFFSFFNKLSPTSFSMKVSQPGISAKFNTHQCSCSGCLCLKKGKG